MIFFTFSYLVSFLPLFALATKFTDCGNGNGRVISMEISNCPDEMEICKIVPGTRTKIETTFVPLVGCKNMTWEMYALILEEPVYWKVPQPNACTAGVMCPVMRGQKCSYINEMQLPESMPAVELPIRFVLVNDKGDNVICSEVLIDIQDLDNDL